MISNKRISKLKKEIYKIKGDLKYSKFLVKTREGLYLFQLRKNTENHKECYTPIDNPRDGLEVVECSDYSIDDILIVGNGESEPTVLIDDILEDIPNDVKERFKNSCIKNPDNPYKELSTEDLKALIDL
ncbi:hypothetical protein [Clostridium sp.]|uniref:hypothetical protein n=1 Tax=Clostridium sp. TaxID=1506 RepID=UPI0025BDD2D3|nr:hypothetical protein [Clostridium sp.]